MLEPEIKMEKEKKKSKKEKKRKRTPILTNSLPLKMSPIFTSN